MRRRLPSLIATSSILVTGSLAQAGPDLVKDINTRNTGLSSMPVPGTGDRELRDSFVKIGGRIYFVAADDTHGAELWATNGKPSETKLVKDIRPGGQPANIRWLVVVGTRMFFSADDGTHGAELWVSDGSGSGTRLVRDLQLGSLPSGPTGITKFQGGVAFQVRLLNPTTRRWETHVYKSDGTAAGTTRLFSATTSSARILGSNASGTHVYYYWAANGNGQLIAITGAQQWNAILNGPSLNADVLIPHGSRVFLSVGSAVRRLYVSSGTAATTVEVVANLSVDLANAKVLGNRLYFSALAQNNWRPFSTDGTANGTEQLSATSLRLTSATGFGSKVLLSTTDEILETQGTQASTKRVFHDPTVRGIADLFSTGSVAYFHARDSRTNSGQELWTTNGTQQGTQLVKQIDPRLGFGGLVVPHFQETGAGSVVFAARDDQHGMELWKSDGAANTTVMLRDIRGANATKPSNPKWFAELGCDVYFSADDGVHGAELWVSDGTANGTRMVKDIQAGTGSNPEYLVRLGDRILFSATGNGRGIELWSSDGTSSGTQLLQDIRGFGSSSPRHLTRTGDRVWFSADDGTHGRELWISDGTAVGTRMVKDINGNNAKRAHSNPQDFAELGYSGRVVFRAQEANGDPELWISDGSLAGTTILKFHNGLQSLAPAHMTRVGGGKVVFAASDTANDRELWITDGTNAGTFRLKNLSPGSSNPEWFSAWDEPGGAVFVAMTDQPRLFMTDGTTQGTRALETFGHSPQYATISGNRDVFFSGVGTNSGRELWRTNGPATTTIRMRDVNPGTGSSAPESAAEGGRRVFADIDGKLFLSSDDGSRGRELYVVETRAWHKQVGRPCGASGRLATLHTTSPKLATLWQWNGRNAPVGWAGASLLSAKPAVPGQGCGLHVDANTVVVAPFGVTTPSWSFGIPIPNDASLKGLRLMTQAAYVRPVVQTVDFTNAVLGVVGS